MKTLIILILGALAGIAGMWYYTKKHPANCSSETKSLVSSPQKNQKMAKAIAANVVVNGEQLIQAAKQAELGKNEAFDIAIYKLGEQLNESIEKSLHLSSDEKNRIDQLLKENYPKISKEARKAYLEGIKTLPNHPVTTVTSTEYSTKADVLSGAINSTTCSFANLIFIPLHINVSLSTNIAACYFFQDPCEVLLSGVMDHVGQRIYTAGIVTDIAITRSNLLTQKQSALAELATAETDIKEPTSDTIFREIRIGGYKKRWIAATLNIDYDISLKYGYDLSLAFEIERNDAQREIIVHLPEPKLIDATLNPIFTDADDGGFPDLNNSHFRHLYDYAENQAIKQAEKNGIMKNAQDQMKTVLTYIFEPFLNNNRYPYRLQITTSNNRNIKD